MEVLVVRPGALGDVILTLPALAWIRKRHHQARITFVGNPDVIPVLELPGLNGHPYVDRTVSIEAREYLPFFASKVLPEPSKFEGIYLWRKTTDPVFESNLCSLTENLKIADAFQKVERIHQSLFLHQGVADTSQLEEAGFTRTGNPGTSTVVIHAGAGSPKKRWPLDRFCDVAEHLARSGFEIVFTIGPADDDVASDLAARGLRYVLNASFEALRNLFSTSTFYLGNDSGMTHFASACSLETIALFGPTSPDVWAPPKAAAVYRSADLDSISVQEVLDMISARGWTRK